MIAKNQLAGILFGGRSRLGLALLAISAALILLFRSGLVGLAQAQQPEPFGTPPPLPQSQEVGQAPRGMLEVPVSHLYPGGVPTAPNLQNPNGGDPQSAERGMKYFESLNCIGCHADNGGGGMGPSLSKGLFVYGSEPANIFLTIYQGRPNGMPSWGGVLPTSVIWDLVTYVGKLSNAPSSEWGTTFSRSPLSPNLEQVPTEQITTDEPWAHTEKFTSGQKP
ncbi:MAG: c-type cytochrome [Hyphomicrobiales bacterium]|nr:c-type cytochrome [Hyphomicrobiales bacterium]